MTIYELDPFAGAWHARDLPQASVGIQEMALTAGLVFAWQICAPSPRSPASSSTSST
jgi:hypothetical protein